MKALKFMTTRKPITTDRSISSHKAEEKEYHVSVKGFSNLYLLVRPNETKSWIFRYMSPTTSKRDKISFGIYPSVSLSRACELWHEYSEILSKNIDPKVHREQKKADTKQNFSIDNTFSYHADQYFNTLKDNLKDNTLNRKQNCIILMNSYIGKMPLKEISAPKLLEVLLDIQQNSLQKNGKPTDKAKRCAGIANDIFIYAKTRGFCENNPAEGIKTQLDKPRYGHRPAITKPEDFAKLLRDIDELANKVDTNTINVLRLTALLFVRHGDLRHMKWQDVDFDESKWRFQPIKGKGKENMVKEMIVPLPTQAIDILRQQQSINGHQEYVFYSTVATKQPVVSENTVTKHLKKMGYKDIHCVHGFRASAKTMLQEQLKYPAVLVEMGLGHITKDQNGTAYGRFEFLEDRTEMMQTWADYLDALRCGEDVSRFKNRMHDGILKDPNQLLEILLQQIGKDKILSMIK